jgi:hypothetical protein
VAVAEVFGEAADAVGVLSFEAELVTCEVPVGAVACACGLYVGALLAGLPAAGEDDRALHGRALLAVDVLGVAEPDRAEILCGEVDAAVRAVERNPDAAGADGGDLAAGAVLDPGLARWPVLASEGY